VITYDLSGKVAIVTGASQGIGTGIAAALAQAGADLVMSARTPDVLEAAAAEVRALGVRVLTVPADVTKAADIEELMRRAHAEYGRIDILVNNAGGNIGRTFKRAPLLELSEHDWDECINLNLKSVWMASKAAAPHFIEQGKGTVINLASVAGTQEAARPGFSAYGASKAGVIRLTQCMAAEWGPTIRVNCVIPGFIDNPKPTPGRTPAAIAERIKGIAAGRIGKNEDVGSAVVFLCADASEWINGAILPVDGGVKSTGPSGLPATGAGITR
jgi:NAD(P)-dependent dehydrogenase (short-subunit alcohol dehydrogenase family)